MPKSALVRSMPITKALSLVHLARDTGSPGQDKHAFLIIEVYNEQLPEKLEIFEAHLAFTKEQSRKLQEEPESRLQFMLTQHAANVVFIAIPQAVFLKRRDPAKLAMESFQLNAGQKDALFRLIHTQKEITAKPETQTKLSALGKGGASGLSQAHNCYTWALEILRETGLPVEEHETLQVQVKDSIAVNPAAHLPAAAAETDDEASRPRYFFGFGSSGCRP